MCKEHPCERAEAGLQRSTIFTGALFTRAKIWNHTCHASRDMYTEGYMYIYAYINIRLYTDTTEYYLTSEKNKILPFSAKQTELEESCYEK